jgi:hypothetical protein
MDDCANAMADVNGWRSPTERHGSYIVANEFAAVRVSRDDAANGVRLRLTDLRSGQSIWLDPMALEALVWAGVEGRLAPSVEPGFRDSRWSLEPGIEAEG